MKKAIKKEEKELTMRLVQGKKPPKKQLLQLAEIFAGNMSDIARACGKSRQCVKQWKDKDPAFKEAIDAGNVRFVDLALTGLKYHLINKSEKSIHYTLDRLARDKGFGRLIKIQDKSKFEDQFEELSTEDLIELLNKTDNKIKNG